ncbi:hypothetical protein Q4E93_05180 [Flavitalea sp. BT771]|uniref:HYC_CC_PP family protein n=1 Tax=Flavitalea sp. BT771 TaxID=3063329 RepID=UPI0026E30C0A|nr:hypothetical protein [Flavitalea sp. BT771]MDO6429964.1 hypothetical protein [Flavitalea sp. BT771]MDV6217908.1 hypothetical protein [Flavitalea sp. BT771]
MKKAFAIILAVVYLSTSMGATVHMHYCMGKLFSWGLVNQESQNCGLCGMPKSNKGGHCMTMKDGCCKDKQTQIKLDKDQKNSEPAYEVFSLPYETITTSLPVLADIYAVSHIVGHPTANAPPNPGKVPVFLRNCSFRI